MVFTPANIMKAIKNYKCFEKVLEKVINSILIFIIPKVMLLILKIYIFKRSFKTLVRI